MTPGFVPLALKGSPDHGGETFRLKVVAKANDTAVPFRPVSQTPTQPARPTTEHTGQPTISLVRDGDRITGIQVRCACGEVIDLQCSY